MTKPYIIASGCSFTDEKLGLRLERDKHAKEPLDYTGHISWPKIVGDRLGFKSINLGRSGSDNRSIIDRVKDHLISNPKPEAIFIQLSGWERLPVIHTGHFTNLFDITLFWIYEHVFSNRKITKPTLEEAEKELEKQEWYDIKYDTFYKKYLRGWLKRFYGDALGHSDAGNFLYKKYVELEDSRHGSDSHAHASKYFDLYKDLAVSKLHIASAALTHMDPSNTPHTIFNYTFNPLYSLVEYCKLNHIDLVIAQGISPFGLFHLPPFIKTFIVDHSFQRKSGDLNGNNFSWQNSSYRFLFDERSLTEAFLDNPYFKKFESFNKKKDGIKIIGWPWLRGLGGITLDDEHILGKPGGGNELGKQARISLKDSHPNQLGHEILAEKFLEAYLNGG